MGIVLGIPNLSVAQATKQGSGQLRVWGPRFRAIALRNCGSSSVPRMKLRFSARRC